MDVVYSEKETKCNEAICRQLPSTDSRLTNGSCMGGSARLSLKLLLMGCIVPSKWSQFQSSTLVRGSLSSSTLSVSFGCDAALPRSRQRISKYGFRVLI